jgi:hypothetical protein
MINSFSEELEVFKNDGIHNFLGDGLVTFVWEIAINAIQVTQPCDRKRKHGTLDATIHLM